MRKPEEERRAEEMKREGEKEIYCMKYVCMYVKLTNSMRNIVYVIWEKYMKS